MTYFEEEERYEFSNGYSFYANRGIVGLSPDLNISEGYDGGIAAIKTCPCCKERSRRDDLTDKERIELADYMIHQWGRYRNISK